MAKGRMISKDISTSRKVNRLSDRAALLYTWMTPHTDDFGRLEGDALSIKAKVAPMRSVNIDEIDEDLKLMGQNDLIEIYEVDGERYIQIKGFEDHQTFRSDRPRRPLYPAQSTNGRQKTTIGIPDVAKRPRKLSQVKLSQVKDNAAKLAAVPPQKDLKMGKKQLFSDPKPMVLKEFLEWCRKSPHRHIHVIAEWADAEEPAYTTKGQWNAFISRNVRPAMPLIGFTNEQMQEAYDRLRNDLKRKDPKTGREIGFITRYTLETLGGYLLK